MPLLPLPCILDAAADPLGAIFDALAQARDGVAHRFARAARGSVDGMAEARAGSANDSAHRAAQPADRITDRTGHEVHARGRAGGFRGWNDGHCFWFGFGLWDWWGDGWWWIGVWMVSWFEGGEMDEVVGGAATSALGA